MEYPTLVTAWGASKKAPGLELERVVVHEIGHQFWYGIVASNEFEEAWLDEGFTSYAEDLAMADIFGQTPNLPIEASYMTSPAPLSRFSWQYDGHGQYADNVYTRAKLVLAGIERQIGREQMIRVLGTYFDRWKFKHPTTKDFQTVLEEVTGTSWSDYFDQFVYGGKMTDYAVERIHIRRVEQDGRPAYENTVVVRKYDGHYTAVPIVFRFADGTSVEKSWDGKDAQMQFKLISRSPLEWVAIDPERTIVLENRRINNFMRTSVDGKWNVRLNIGFAKLIETIIGAVAW
jgi:aminopeptidase N